MTHEASLKRKRCERSIFRGQLHRPVDTFAYMRRVKWSIKFCRRLEEINAFVL